MCRQGHDVYLDYRWLPENADPYSRDMIQVYARAAVDLRAAADALQRAVTAAWPERVKDLARREVARARFEAAELDVMSHQQAAVHHIGRYLNTFEPDRVRAALGEFKRALSALTPARSLAARAGLARNAYYPALNDWLRDEFTRKVNQWKKACQP